VNGIDDFCKKAQVVNYEQYRALQEGFNAGMWNRYTGMLVWKNQNPWTSLRGQFYDVFLDQNGGFYGYMHGAKPLHVQLNLNDTSVCVVNQTLFDAENLTAEAHLFDLNGNRLNSQKFALNVPANSLQIAGKTDTSKKPKGLYFLRLMLKNKAGETVDENLYWLTSQPKDFQDLETLRPASIDLKTEKDKAGKQYVSVKNTGRETAFFTRLKVMDKSTKDLVLPVFFEDNYITLFPGEEKKLKIDLTHLPPEIKPGNLVLQAEPWNSSLNEIKLQ